MIDSVLQDVRYALRTFRLNPGFSIVAVLCLALGAGANTAMFQLLDAVRVRTLPIRAPQELVEVHVDDMTHARGAWLRERAVTNPLWEAIRREQDVFAGVFAWAAAVGAVRTTLERLGTHRYSFRLYESMVQDSLLRERLMATIAGPFGALATILMALGLYGVFSYTVVQRTNEIGIRMALGADRRTVVMSVVREAIGVLMGGLLVGMSLAVAIGRAAASLLYGLKPYDPVSVTIAAVSLSLVAAIASYLPARRAARVDPMIALRHE
jgi:hypothetical protein